MTRWMLRERPDGLCLAVSLKNTKMLRRASTLVRTRQYHERVVDHYSNPRNVGTLDKNAQDVVMTPFLALSFFDQAHSCLSLRAPVWWVHPPAATSCGYRLRFV